MVGIGEEIALREQGEDVAARDLFAQVRAEIGGVTGPVAGFYPSLHLNPAECYRKLGELGRAREHLAWGRASVAALGNDGYGQVITAGLDRLTDRLA